MNIPWRRPSKASAFSLSLDTKDHLWCREARVVLVEGTGALCWEPLGRHEDWTRESALTLRGTPLIALREAPCPTCAGLLAAGWGLDRADAPELQKISDALNAPFVDFSTSLTALSPLLGLLPAGLYVIAEGDCFPTDGDGHFFWDVPDGFTTVSATGPVYYNYNDADFACTYSEAAPVFLYPSQPRTHLDETRVAWYMEHFGESGDFPRAVAFHCAESVSVLLDGHHKACAAARLGRMLPCITILPLSGYHYARTKTIPPRTVPEKAVFGPFTVPVSRLPAQYLPEQPWRPWKDRRPQPYTGQLARGCTFPIEYTAAGAVYPTAAEYGLVSIGEITPLTPERLAAWLAAPEANSGKLRAALVYMKYHRDSRLKETALRCTAGQGYTPLREVAFRCLAEMKGDREAEQFFIDYFVQADTSAEPALLMDIAHRFWD